MRFLDNFTDWMDKDVEFLTTEYTRNSEGQNIPSSTSSGTVKGAIYTSSQAKAFVSDRFKDEIKGVIIVDPAKVTFPISGQDKVIIDSIEYAVIQADDILRQNDVYVIPFRELNT